MTASLLFLRCVYRSTPEVLTAHPQHPSSTHSASLGPIFLDNCTCCHSQTEVAGPFSPSHPATARVATLKQKLQVHSYHLTQPLHVLPLSNRSCRSILTISLSHCTCCHSQTEVAGPFLPSHPATARVATLKQKLQVHSQHLTQPWYTAVREAVLAVTLSRYLLAMS